MNVKLFRFELVPDSKEGMVFPPLMVITYSDIPITDVATQTVSVSPANTHMHTLIFLSGLWSATGPNISVTTALLKFLSLPCYCFYYLLYSLLLILPLLSY